MIAGPGRSWSNPRAAFTTCAPESAKDHFVAIERVVEMGRDSSKVHAANARNRRLRVGCSRSRKRGDDPERLLEFLGKHVPVVTIGQPPGFLSPNVLLCRGREAKASILQRDRSSRRMTSASKSRPALTSSSESLRA